MTSTGLHVFIVVADNNRGSLQRLLHCLGVLNGGANVSGIVLENKVTSPLGITLVNNLIMPQREVTFADLLNLFLELALVHAADIWLCGKPGLVVAGVVHRLFTQREVVLSADKQTEWAVKIRPHSAKQQYAMYRTLPTLVWWSSP